MKEKKNEKEISDINVFQATLLVWFIDIYIYIYV